MTGKEAWSEPATIRQITARSKTAVKKAKELPALSSHLQPARYRPSTRCFPSFN